MITNTEARTHWLFPNATAEEPTGHLSPSQVVRMLTCGECFYAERVLRIPKPVGINLPIGSAAHKAVEYMRLERLAQRKVKVSDAVEIGVGHFEQEVSQPVDDESGVELVIDLGSTYKSLDQAKDKVAELARYALPLLAQIDDARGGLAAVEVSLDYFKSPYPFPFTGRIDALYGKSIEGATSISDLKTSKDRNKAPDTDAGIQLALYSEFLPGISAMADVLSKTQPPELHSWRLDIDDAGRARVHKLVLDVAANISAGRFLPSPSWKCNYSHGLPGFVS